MRKLRGRKSAVATRFELLKGSKGTICTRVQRCRNTPLQKELLIIEKKKLSTHIHINNSFSYNPPTATAIRYKIT